MADQIALMFRNEGGRVLATLIRLLGDFELAEDAMRVPSQQHFISGQSKAFRQIPARGWSMSAATRRSIA